MGGNGKRIKDMIWNAYMKAARATASFIPVMATTRDNGAVSAACPSDFSL